MSHTGFVASLGHLESEVADGGNIAPAGSSSVTATGVAGEQILFFSASVYAANPTPGSPCAMDLTIEVGSTTGPTIVIPGSSLTAMDNVWRFDAPKGTYVAAPDGEDVVLTLNNNDAANTLQVTRLNLMFIRRKVVSYE